MDDSHLMDSQRPLLEDVSANRDEVQHKFYTQNVPKIMLETISARTAMGILALTYTVFALALLFDIRTTVQGFNNQTVDLQSTSCASQNISIGITEGDYGCTLSTTTSESGQKTLTWIGHAAGFSNVISVAVKAKLSNTSAIYYNGSYVDDDEFIEGLTFKYDLGLYCCYSDRSCGNVSIVSEDGGGGGDWKRVIYLDNEKINVEKYYSVEDGESSTVTLLPNTFQNQETLPTQGKVKSYLVYIQFDQAYSTYQAWDQITYTFRDISRPDNRTATVALPFVIFITVLCFLVYLHAIYKITRGRLERALPEQKWLIVYFIAVICFQNPIYCSISFLRRPSPTAVYLCYVLDAISQSVLITVWLLFADGLRRQMDYYFFYPPKIITGLCVFIASVVVLTMQFPSVNTGDHRSPVEAVANWSYHTKMVFISFSIVLILLLWLWTFWWFYSLAHTGSALQKLPYMTTRYLQLSFRFFSLQATLVTLYYTLENVLILFYILQRSNWKKMNLENVTDDINTLFRQQSLAFGKVVFLTTYGIILAFFFIPANTFSTSTDAESSLLGTSLAVTYVVSEREMKIVRRKRRRALHSLRALRQLADARPDVFCVDLALELSELAVQAYNDGGGLVTASGYAAMDVVSLNYDLVDQMYDKAHEAVCYILRHRETRRLVVIYRGTASRQHWSDNLKFTQRRVDLLDNRLVAVDAEDGLQVNEDTNAAGLQHQSLFGGGESDSDSDNEGYEMASNHPRRSPRSRGESFSSSTGHDMGRGFRNSFADGASRVEDELKRAAYTVVDATQTVVGATAGLLKTAASHTPVLQYAVNIYIHSGFYDVYLTTREFVHTVLRRELSREPGDVYFTGHSMGAAAACIAAADVALSTIPRVNRFLKNRQDGDDDVHCGITSDRESHASTADSFHMASTPRKRVRVGLYTFGCPRVGNWNFSSLLNRVVPDSFRVVVDGDIVTAIPKGNYKHVGTEILIDAAGSGTIIIDPSFVESRLQKSSKTSMDAHTMVAYRRGLLGIKAATEYVQSWTTENVHGAEGAGDTYSKIDIHLALESSKVAIDAATEGVK